MSQAHTVHLELDNEDLALLHKLMDLGVAKSRAAITRTQNFPSDTLSSVETRDKHLKIIDHIEFLRAHLDEKALR